MDKSIPWKQDLINNVIWYIIFNFVGWRVLRPAGGEMGIFRISLSIIFGFIILASFFKVIKILTIKWGWFVSLLIMIPFSVLVNMLVI